MADCQCYREFVGSSALLAKGTEMKLAIALSVFLSMSAAAAMACPYNKSAQDTSAGTSQVASASSTPASSQTQAK